MNRPDQQLCRAWSFFDRIYCISIDQRRDRREKVRIQFTDVGLLDRVEFVIVAKHPENRAQGIFESHLHCLRKGLEAGADHILIFEDDVFFQKFSPTRLHEACAALENSTNWGALFLGCITGGSKKTEHKSLVQVEYRCLAHGYALNRSFAQHIVREKWSGIPFDELLRRRQKSFYALYPMCAFQGRGGTDNQTVAIDRMRRFFGGLPFIQRANEFYQNHKKVLLSINLILLLGLACLVFSLW
ncbi:MAG: glycosyltransferase [Desulfobulbaceae bacterium]|nr:glycosyltransferase [Desulfobulbaceae bacterium]